MDARKEKSKTINLKIFYCFSSWVDYPMINFKVKKNSLKLCIRKTALFLTYYIKISTQLFKMNNIRTQLPYMEDD